MFAIRKFYISRRLLSTTTLLLLFLSITVSLAAIAQAFFKPIAFIAPYEFQLLPLVLYASIVSLTVATALVFTRREYPLFFVDNNGITGFSCCVDERFVACLP